MNTRKNSPSCLHDLGCFFLYLQAFREYRDELVRSTGEMHLAKNQGFQRFSSGSLFDVTVNGYKINLECSINKEYNAVYISIGAHADKKIGIDGEDATTGVTSAVEMLRAIGDDEMPDYTGKRVVVIGGGNVAMDVARSSVRLGAEKVSLSLIHI